MRRTMDGGGSSDGEALDENSSNILGKQLISLSRQAQDVQESFLSSLFATEVDKNWNSQLRSIDEMLLCRSEKSEQAIIAIELDRVIQIDKVARQIKSFRQRLDSSCSKLMSARISGNIQLIMESQQRLASICAEIDQKEMSEELRSLGTIELHPSKEYDAVEALLDSLVSSRMSSQLIPQPHLPHSQFPAKLHQLEAQKLESSKVCEVGPLPKPSSPPMKQHQLKEQKTETQLHAAAVVSSNTENWDQALLPTQRLQQSPTDLIQLGEEKMETQPITPMAMSISAEVCKASVLPKPRSLFPVQQSQIMRSNSNELKKTETLPLVFTALKTEPLIDLNSSRLSTEDSKQLDEKEATAHPVKWSWATWDSERRSSRGVLETGDLCDSTETSTKASDGTVADESGFDQSSNDWIFTPLSQRACTPPSHSSSSAIKMESLLPVEFQLQSAVVSPTFQRKLNLVEIYDASSSKAIVGHRLLTLGMPGRSWNADIHLNKPIGCNFDETSRTWIVCDCGHNAVKLFAEDGSQTAVIKRTLKKPAAVAMVEQGRLFAVQDATTIQLFDFRSGNDDACASVVGPLRRPCGLAISGSGLMVTLTNADDGQRAKVESFDWRMPHQAVAVINYCPQNSNDLPRKPRFIDAAGDTLAISDTGANMVFLMSLVDGKTIRSFKPPTTRRSGHLYSLVAGVRFDGDANLLVGDSKGGCVQLFDDAEGFKCELDLGRPQAAGLVGDLHLTSDGRLMVADRHLSAVNVFQLSSKK